MPSWNEVLKDIEVEKSASPLDRVRRRYLSELHKKRQERNIICYYSGFLQKSGIGHTEIDDNDKNGFMAVIHRLDRTKGLDLILHTPGGQIAATESIVDYLYRMFDGNIEVFVPQLAMSAGTMIALASRKIFMGKQSNLGPIDPHIMGIPTQGVLMEFEQAKEAIKEDPAQIPLWQTIVGKYPPSFLVQCKNAAEWSKQLVTKWLEEGMFCEKEKPHEAANNVVKFFSSMAETKTHSRHIGRDTCREQGLTIADLESDQELQDIVLTVHHTYMHTFAQSPAIKIIENHLGNAMVIQVQMVARS